MNRKEKFDKVFKFLEDSNVVIVQNECIGQVNVDAARVKDTWLYTGLIHEGMAEEEIKEFIDFIKKIRCTLVSLANVCGVSFENCELNTGMIMKHSKLWEEDKE